MNPFPVQRASQLASSGPQTQWLVEDLWTEQAVGILGGEPKCCKSFLALDVAVSVASGTACLRQFPVRRSGPVLLFPAEDSLAVVRQRLEGIAAAAQVPFAPLPVQVITAPSLRLDSWKQIAAYLCRGERTVKRWETERGLPIHRLPGGGRGSVHAITAELDEWLVSAEVLEIEIGEEEGAAEETDAEAALPAEA